MLCGAGRTGMSARWAARKATSPPRKESSGAALSINTSPAQTHTSPCDDSQPPWQPAPLAAPGSPLAGLRG